MTCPRPIVLAIALLGPVCLSIPREAGAQAMDSTLVARYQLAESFLRAAQFDRAIALLEGLVERSPETFVFYDKLREAYESVKRYDDGIALIEGRRPPGEAGAPLLAEKARLQFLKGEEVLAFETWDATLALAPASPGVYLVVYRSLMQMRLFEKATEVLEQGRRSLGSQDLFQADLAYLYSLTSRHADAAREYMKVLAENERQITFVRGRLSQQIEDETALASTLEVVDQFVREAPLNRAYRELVAWLYLESGRYQEALDANRAIDRLEGEQGQGLYAFGQQAGDAGAYAAALSAYEEILQRYPEAPAAPEAMQGTGLLYELWADRSREAGQANADSLYNQAVAAYERFVSAYPGHELLPEVFFRIGKIRQDIQRDYPGARAAFERILTGWPNTDTADQASFELGRQALRQGQLDEARTRYARLADNLRTGELAEAARFELALIHFYRGEFDAALSLTESMKENTAADVSNDAIGLKVLLVESRGPDSLDTPLRGLAAARLDMRQGHPQSALDKVDDVLAQLGNHALLDELMFERAGILASLGRTQEAVAAYKEFPLVHAESYLADRSLFEAARLESETLGNSQEAIATLTRLLADYPGSLLAAQSRERIRALRGDGT